MDSMYYKPSGKFSGSVFVFFAVFAVISIPILACAYTNIIYHMPYVYFNVLAAGGFAIAMGYILGKAITFGKCRNTLVASGIAIFSVVLMKYVSWAFYIPIVFSDAYEVVKLSFLERLEASWYFFLDPIAVLEYMYEISQVGVWSLFSITFSGILLYVVWFFEICLFVGICNMMARSAAKEPFCEEANKWFIPRKKEIEFNLPLDIEQFKSSLEGGHTSDFIEMLNKEFTNADNYLSAKIYSLDDVDYGYMTVQNVTKTADKKGNEKLTETDIIENIKIGHDVMQCTERRAVPAEASTPAE